MITRVMAKGFRALREVDVAVRPFQVLVGPNGSGKSSLLDVPGFLADVTEHGVVEAVRVRGDSVRDLTWGRGDGGFTLAVEATIPEALGKVASVFDRARYELTVADGDDGVAVVREVLSLPSRAELPLPKLLLERTAKGRDRIYWEHKAPGDGWGLDLRSNPRVSALGNVLRDEERLPLTLCFSDLLTRGLRRVALQEPALHRPGGSGVFTSDGAYLPAAVKWLEVYGDAKTRWVEHLQTALPDVVDVTVKERPEDRQRYVSVTYRDGVEVPAWSVSEGTLRLMALTVLAYDPESVGRSFLVEEPEDGIHPRALETAYQSLEGMYDAQVMLTTHSALLLNLVRVDDVLCFTRDDAEGARVVPGPEHPALLDWQRDANLGMLFASGVLE